MEHLSEYERFCEAVENCDTEDNVKELQKKAAVRTLKNEFFRQRKNYFNAATALDKQKARAKLQWIQQFFGCSIPLKSNVSRFNAPEGLYGIIISPLSLIGADCTISRNVSIIGSANSGAVGAPVIGNNVFIGAGAVIKGNVHIGAFSEIGAGCVITKDIPPYSVVETDGLTVASKKPEEITEVLTLEEQLERRFSQVYFDYNDLGNKELTTKKAKLNELDEIWDMYKERTLWFRFRKKSQWLHYLDRHPRSEFAGKIDNGEYYTVRLNGKLIGGFALSSDSENWEDDDTKARYLCRVVSRIGYRNLGNYMVEQAKKIGAKMKLKYLRLECVYSNSKLNEIWESLGFEFIIDKEADYHCSLRQLRL